MLSAGPDCGFLTARGYRAFKTRPLSRMAARREALARDITSIHGDEFMRVYGYRKVWRVVPEKLRTLDRGRPWRDSQFASTRLSPSRDMSR